MEKELLQRLVEEERRGLVEEELRRLVEEDKEFRRIDQEIPDYLVSQYIKGRDTNGLFGRGSLNNYEWLFHEKWEIRELLKIRILGIIPKYHKNSLSLDKVRVKDFKRAHESAEKNTSLFKQRIEYLLGIPSK